MKGSNSESGSDNAVVDSTSSSKTSTYKSTTFSALAAAASINLGSSHGSSRRKLRHRTRLSHGKASLGSREVIHASSSALLSGSLQTSVAQKKGSSYKEEERDRKTYDSAGDGDVCNENASYEENDHNESKTFMSEDRCVSREAEATGRMQEQLLDAHKTSYKTALYTSSDHGVHMAISSMSDWEPPADLVPAALQMLMEESLLLQRDEDTQLEQAKSAETTVGKKTNGSVSVCVFVRNACMIESMYLCMHMFEPIALLKHCVLCT